MYDNVICAPLKIIAADDSKELLEVIKLVLETEGYQVRVSLNGRDIMELIWAEKPDVILLDIDMHGVDGCEICKKLKAGTFSSGIPVIMLSGNDELDKASDYCGADSYLSKPFDLEDLLAKIDGMVSTT